VKRSSLLSVLNYKLFGLKAAMIGSLVLHPNIRLAFKNLQRTSTLAYLTSPSEKKRLKIMFAGMARSLPLEELLHSGMLLFWFQILDKFGSD
jgi:hypothetical protein